MRGSHHRPRSSHSGPVQPSPTVSRSLCSGRRKIRTRRGRFPLNRPRRHRVLAPRLARLPPWLRTSEERWRRPAVRRRRDGANESRRGGGGKGLWDERKYRCPGYTAASGGRRQRSGVKCRGERRMIRWKRERFRVATDHPEANSRNKRNERISFKIHRASTRSVQNNLSDKMSFIQHGTGVCVWRYRSLAVKRYLDFFNNYGWGGRTCRRWNADVPRVPLYAPCPAPAFQSLREIKEPNVYSSIHNVISITRTTSSVRRRWAHVQFTTKWSLDLRTEKHSILSARYFLRQIR